MILCSVVSVSNIYKCPVLKHAVSTPKCNTGQGGNCPLTDTYSSIQTRPGREIVVSSAPKQGRLRHADTPILSCAPKVPRLGPGGVYPVALFVLDETAPHSASTDSGTGAGTHTLRVLGGVQRPAENLGRCAVPQHQKQDTVFNFKLFFH